MAELPLSSWIPSSLRAWLAATRASPPRRGDVEEVVVDAFVDCRRHRSLDWQACEVGGSSCGGDLPEGEVRGDLMRVQERRDSSDEAFVAHFRIKYDDQMPIWALTELLELGHHCRLYGACATTWPPRSRPCSVCRRSA